MMAVGLADPAEAETLWQHAATCDWCGAVLREAFQDLVEPPTEPEIEVAASTKLANPRERRQMAESLAVQRRRPWPGWRWLVPLVAAPAAAVTIFLVTGPDATERLLARAYHEQRTSEFRLARADYDRVTLEMGERSAFSQPASLLEAQAKLARQLKTHPDSPNILRMQGEADLIAHHTSAAIESLEKAHDLHPQDARILADLGVAFALRGDTQGQPADYHIALDDLNQSLHLHPADPELLFNRALVLDKAQLYDQALQAWDEYLKIDGASAWATEARTRRAQLLEKMKTRKP